MPCSDNYFDYAVFDGEILERVLSGLKDVCVGVVGDFCLDVYWEIDNSRNENSVETGLTTNAVRTERFSPGGAGNVAMNLQALGVGDIMVFGTVGHDPYGAAMQELLSLPGIDLTGLQVLDEWHTHLFVKPMRDGVEQPRFDIGNFNRIDQTGEEQILAALEVALRRIDVLIINQQIIPGASIHSASFRLKLVNLLSARRTPVCLVDSRDYTGDFEGCLRKMNDRELEAVCRGAGINPPSAAALATAWSVPVVVTRAEKETIVADEEGELRVPAYDTSGEAIDPVGGGDSFIAGMAAALAKGESLSASAGFGNLCAGVTIRKIGITGTASPGEMRNLFRDGHLLHAPERAELPLAALHLKNPDREILRERSAAEPFTHAVFDHDGTISVLREGWEAIMEPMMIDCILGKCREAVDAEALRRIVVRVRDFIEQTTGIQTLVQMKGLTALVGEFGYVPEKEILDPFGYKEIYNQALLAMVDARIRRIDEGVLTRDDFLVKGARNFLRMLAERGVVLYLASGTDEEDVKKEAELLGYADLFTGGIYGAIGKIDVDAKREVLGRILSEIGDGAKVVTFGDGPVEVRETRRIGGYTVGLASDEVRRYGWNASKRRRLIRAGADMLVPDFLDPESILDALT